MFFYCTFIEQYIYSDVSGNAKNLLGISAVIGSAVRFIKSTAANNVYK